MSNPNNRQVDGTHYKKGGAVQHWDFVDRNELDYLTGCATKYIARNRFKHPSPIKDLEKAQHYIDKIYDQVVRGFKKPRGTIIPLVISVDAFAKANDLTPIERDLVHDLVYWEQKEVLAEAVMTLQSLIDATENK